jgi:hypothetical protein
MTALALADPTRLAETPAERLRRTAAAVRVHFTWLGTHKALTSTQKEEVGLTYDADSKLLTAGKRLIDVRHERFKAMTTIKSRIASYWRTMTLPYVESGVRLIRQSDLGSFIQTMEGFREELHQAEAELNAVYDHVLADARQRLGRLFNADDYPTEIRGLFEVEWDFPSIEPPQYLMRLNPDLFRQEQERVTHRFEEAVQLAEQAFIDELAKLVGHLTERLTGDGETKIFRDSAVTNLTEFFQRFQKLNVRSNVELDALVEQAQELVSGVTPQALRDNAGLRSQVATAMSQLQSELDGIMVAAPRRRIIRSSGAVNGNGHAPAD